MTTMARQMTRIVALLAIAGLAGCGDNGDAVLTDVDNDTASAATAATGSSASVGLDIVADQLKAGDSVYADWNKRGTYHNPPTPRTVFTGTYEPLRYKESRAPLAPYEPPKW